MSLSQHFGKLLQLTGIYIHIYIYIFFLHTYIHTHTHTYIYIYTQYIHLVCSNISCTFFFHLFFSFRFFHQQTSSNNKPNRQWRPLLKSSSPKIRGYFPNGCHGYLTVRHRASGRTQSTVRDQDADQDREDVFLVQILYTCIYVCTIYDVCVQSTYIMDIYIYI